MDLMVVTLKVKTMKVAHIYSAYTYVNIRAPKDMNIPYIQGVF